MGVCVGSGGWVVSSGWNRGLIVINTTSGVICR